MNKQISKKTFEVCEAILLILGWFTTISTLFWSGWGGIIILLEGLVLSGMYWLGYWRFTIFKNFMFFVFLLVYGISLFPLSFFLGVLAR